MSCDHREPPESAFTWSHWATCECGERRYERRPGREWARVDLVSDDIYDGLRADDGTPINSRTKRRAWMRAAGVADATDYRETWQRMKAERERGPSEAEMRQRTEEVGRIAYQLQTQRKRR